MGSKFGRVVLSLILVLLLAMHAPVLPCTSYRSHHGSTKELEENSKYHVVREKFRVILVFTERNSSVVLRVVLTERGLYRVNLSVARASIERETSRYLHALAKFYSIVRVYSPALRRFFTVPDYCGALFATLEWPDLCIIPTLNETKLLIHLEASPGARVELLFELVARYSEAQPPPNVTLPDEKFAVALVRLSIDRDGLYIIRVEPYPELEIGCVFLDPNVPTWFYYWYDENLPIYLNRGEYYLILSKCVSGRISVRIEVVPCEYFVLRPGNQLTVQLSGAGSKVFIVLTQLSPYTMYRLVADCISEMTVELRFRLYARTHLFIERASVITRLPLLTQIIEFVFLRIRKPEVRGGMYWFPSEYFYLYLAMTTISTLSGSVQSVDVRTFSWCVAPTLVLEISLLSNVNKSVTVIISPFYEVKPEEAPVGEEISFNMVAGKNVIRVFEVSIHPMVEYDVSIALEGGGYLTAWIGDGNLNNWVQSFSANFDIVEKECMLEYVSANETKAYLVLVWSPDSTKAGIRMNITEVEPIVLDRQVTLKFDERNKLALVRFSATEASAYLFKFELDNPGGDFIYTIFSSTGEYSLMTLSERSPSTVMFPAIYMRGNTTFTHFFRVRGQMYLLIRALEVPFTLRVTIVSPAGPSFPYLIATIVVSTLIAVSAGIGLLLSRMKRVKAK